MCGGAAFFRWQSLQNYYKPACWGDFWNKEMCTLNYVYFCVGMVDVQYQGKVQLFLFLSEVTFIHTYINDHIKN